MNNIRSITTRYNIQWQKSLFHWFNRVRKNPRSNSRNGSLIPQNLFLNLASFRLRGNNYVKFVNGLRAIGLQVGESQSKRELKRKIYRSLKYSIEIERQRTNVIKQSSKDRSYTYAVKSNLNIYDIFPTFECN